MRKATDNQLLIRNENLKQYACIDNAVASDDRRMRTLCKILYPEETASTPTASEALKDSETAIFQTDFDDDVM